MNVSEVAIDFKCNHHPIHYCDGSVVCLIGNKIKWKNCDGSSGIVTTTSSNVIFLSCSLVWLGLKRDTPSGRALAAGAPAATVQGVSRLEHSFSKQPGSASIAFVELI